MRKFVRTPPMSIAVAGLAREAVAPARHVGRRAADVDHQRVAQPRQERGAADAVGRAAADRQHRVADGVVERHQRAVVLGEEHHARRARGRASAASHAVATAARDTSRSAALITAAFSRSSSPIEPISWLSVTGTSAPSTSRDDVARAQLVVVGRPARTTLVRSPPPRPVRRPREEAAHRVLVQRRRSRGRRTRCPPATIASPAEHRVAQLGRPAVERRDRQSPDGAPIRTAATRLQPAALEHGVGGVRRAEHHVAVRARLDGAARRPGRRPAPRYTRRDVGAGRTFGLGHDAVGGSSRPRRCWCRRRRCRAAGQSRPSCGQLLHRDVVEVGVAEGGAGRRSPARAACARAGRRGRR